jgi:hypothetical protein
MIGHERLSAAALRLWKAQAELCRAADQVADMIGECGELARTVGDDGEYLAPEVFALARKVRGVALSMDRALPEMVHFLEQENATS